MHHNTYFYCLLLAALCAACSHEHYRFNTQIARNGSCLREVLTFTADSAFLAGDLSQHPFPYELSPEWSLQLGDSSKISKTFASVQELSVGLKPHTALPYPRESLKKRFRGFYSYYDFEAVYPRLAYIGTVPIDQYLSADEQQCFFQGDMSAYRGLNGMELKGELDELENKFLQWYAHSIYEEYIDVIGHFAQADGQPYAAQIPNIKDILFASHKKDILESSEKIDSKFICTLLDTHFSGKQFTALHAQKHEEIEQWVEEKLQLEQYEVRVQYALSLPGKLLSANTELREHDSPLWKVDAFKLLAQDYSLAASSRTTNHWFFVLAGLLLTCAVFCLGKSFNLHIFRDFRKRQG